MTENLKNEHAQALGKLKKGKKEKPSELKSDSSRINAQKARDARKAKALQGSKPIDPEPFERE